MSVIKTVPSSIRRPAGGDIIRTLMFVGIVTLIFAQYLTTAVPAYLILILGLLIAKGGKLPKRVILYLCAVVFYWIAILSNAVSQSVVTHILFYFGFLFPFLAFARTRNLSVTSFVNERAVVILCVLTILEAALFNSPIGEHLYFFPPEGSQDRVAMLGFYQRPTGLAGNASMTSGVLFFLIALSERIWGALKFRTLLLVVLTTIVMASGTGFGMLLLYLLVSAFRTTNIRTRYMRATFALAMLVLGGAFAFGLLGEFDDFNKFTADYFSLIYEYKKFQFEMMFDGATFETNLLGNQIAPDFVAATSGDAGILVTPYSIGIIGSLMLFTAPLLFFRALWQSLIPTLFFYISFIHYPGLLSPPGQILFACYLYVLMEASRWNGRMLFPNARSALTPSSAPLQDHSGSVIATRA